MGLSCVCLAVSFWPAAADVTLEGGFSGLCPLRSGGAGESSRQAVSLLSPPRLAVFGHRLAVFGRRLPSHGLCPLPQVAFPASRAAASHQVRIILEPWLPPAAKPFPFARLTLAASVPGRVFMGATGPYPQAHFQDEASTGWGVREC